jgi:nucleoside-diphosphate-sugar epimerase
VRALANSGHTVVTPLRRTVAEYSGLRHLRVSALAAAAEVVENCAFGSERFIELVKRESWDVLCHHAARVGDYRDPDYDVVGALAENTASFNAVLRSLMERGLRGVVATGSVFESNEGVGNTPVSAFSPYGLSKALTWSYIEHFCRVAAVPVGKFVIPNPFGPLEEPRFTSYLLKTWYSGKVPSVRTPLYVRDNIHVLLLAEAYRKFVEGIILPKAEMKLNPSGYVEQQGAFALRMAKEMASRLAMECPVELSVQVDFSEPLVRINTDTVKFGDGDKAESALWDAFAEYYSEELARL